MSTSSLYPVGKRLLEIFYVVVNGSDGQNPGNLYGTINVIDNAGTESIWTHTKSECVSIRPKGNFVLEGPSRPLYAANDLAIELDLWSHNPSDVQIANGWITFTPRGSDADYDFVKTEEVKTASGSVSVNYMAISDALHAQIEIILIDAPIQDTNNLYGDIYAYNGYGTVGLFHKVEGEGVDTEKGAAITLSRRVVAVPTSKSLSVEASLYNAESLKIASGLTEFKPSYNDSQNAFISGGYGKIEVRVSWM